jgi:hypothetical protein
MLVLGKLTSYRSAGAVRARAVFGLPCPGLGHFKEMPLQSRATKRPPVAYSLLTSAGTQAHAFASSPTRTRRTSQKSQGLKRCTVSLVLSVVHATERQMKCGSRASKKVPRAAVVGFAFIRSRWSDEVRQPILSPGSTAPTIELFRWRTNFRPVGCGDRLDAAW